MDECHTYVMEAMGAYVSSPSPQLVQGIREIAGKDIRGGSAIFICPERVVRFADSESVLQELAFRKVLYHELSHAYMDVGIYSTHKTWQSVLEESNANAIALSCFESSEDRANAIRLMQKQPVEYRGYPYICASLLSSFAFGLFVWRRIPFDLLVRLRWYELNDLLILLQEAGFRYFNLLTLWLSYKRYSSHYLEAILKPCVLDILRAIAGVK